MLRIGFDRGGERERPLLGHALGRSDVHDHWPALRQRPGLVEDDDLQLAGALECDAVTRGRVLGTGGFPSGMVLNGYRDYTSEAVERLAFVRDAQASGSSLAEIASILELRGQGVPTCRQVVELLERHLAEIYLSIEAMRASRDAYATMIERARALDPADCTDPARCQTISTDHVPSGEGHVHAAHDRWHPHHA